MARAIWSGAISFGLVNVGVKAYSATRDHNVHFRELTSTGGQVKHQKVSAKTGKPIEDIRLGYERSNGKYVVFDRDELDALQPASTRTIDVADFVDLEDIDPIYYRKTYWLAPAGDESRRAYALLRTAMEQEQKVGIGSVVMRNKQYLAAVRPLDHALAMSTMRFADEVIDRSSIDALERVPPKPKPKEVQLATQIIDALASDWDPKRYHDTYTEELRDLIERRAKGEEIEIEEIQPERAEVVDLMQALEQSIARAKKKPRRASARKKKSA